jgi:hypothetical protein
VSPLMIPIATIVTIACATAFPKRVGGLAPSGEGTRWVFPKSRRLFDAPFVTIHCAHHTSHTPCLRIQVTNAALQD